MIKQEIPIIFTPTEILFNNHIQTKIPLWKVHNLIRKMQYPRKGHTKTSYTEINMKSNFTSSLSGQTVSTSWSFKLCISIHIFREGKFIKKCLRGSQNFQSGYLVNILPCQSQFLKTGKNDGFFKCPDTKTNFQETWRIRETLHNENK